MTSVPSVPVLATVAAGAVSGVFAVGLVATVWPAAARSTWRRVVCGIRWGHVAGAAPVLVLTVALAAALLSLPLLDLGWWRLLGGHGNPALGMTGGSGAAAAVGWLFLLAFLAAVPMLALEEERIFRTGAEERSRPAEARAALRFGLAHALAGAPLGAALALAVPGVWFSTVYRRAWRRSGEQEQALLDAARAHTAWNLLVVAVLTAVGLA